MRPTPAFFAALVFCFLLGGGLAASRAFPRRRFPPVAVRLNEQQSTHVSSSSLPLRMTCGSFFEWSTMMSLACT